MELFHWVRLCGGRSGAEVTFFSFGEESNGVDEKAASRCQGGFAGAGPVSGFRDVPCGNIGPCPDHYGSRRKGKQGLWVLFAAEDVFHGFIAVAPVKIRSGPLQPRPEWGGLL